MSFVERPIQDCEWTCAKKLVSRQLSRAQQLCTTAFLVEISQYIMISEVASSDNTDTPGAVTPSIGVSTPPVDPRKLLKIPSFNLKGVGFFQGADDDLPSVYPRRSKRDEDAELIESTGSFADWVASFIRRVILLLENLPEEGVTGNFTGGASEGELLHLKNCQSSNVAHSVYR
jgi:proteasome activator subunit 4